MRGFISPSVVRTKKSKNALFCVIQRTLFVGKIQEVKARLKFCREIPIVSSLSKLLLVKLPGCI